MSEQLFRFKQFNVAQGKCAMKVNTDGVLLGAWAEVDNAKHILDIGTGTGVIALMMAQKNNTALIDAIDIDEAACAQAHDNFENSEWYGRLKVVHSSLQNFLPDKKYDVIISNPPYFIDDQKGISVRKNVAKHTVALTYNELLAGIVRLLHDNGKAFMVIPAFNLSVIEAIANEYNLFITACTEVAAVEDKPPYLVLIKVEQNIKEILKSSVTIQDSAGNFTDRYKMLTKDFYLKF